MASPTVQATNESSTNTAGTSHTVNLPAFTGGSAANDIGKLLMVFLNKGSTAATVNALGGWNELADENLGNGLYIAWRKVDGTEGSTITLTTSGTTRSAEITYLIAGAKDPSVQPPEIAGATATGASVNPDPPSVTPTGGSRDYLFIACAGMDGEEADDDTWANTPPSNYLPNPPLQKSCGTAGVNLGGKIMVASRALTAASDDPDTFNVDVSANWRAQTVVVHPSTSLPPPPLFRGWRAHMLCR